MDFVGNQINIKNIVATLLATFFIGRINLFGGTFPAAIACIAVMLAVSTVYIYLIPILLAAMATYMGQGVILYGDFFAVLLLGIFFAFFHQQKFTINQRTTIAIAATMLCNCLYYAATDILFLLKPETLLKEALAIMVYIRVWNLIAKLLYTGPAELRISREKVELALEIFVVSLIGSIGMAELVFPLWVFLAAAVLQQRGLQPAFTLIVLGGIFWFCQGETEWGIFPILFGGFLVGWYGAMLVDGRYRKVVLAAAIFFAVGMRGGFYSGGLQVYGIAIAMMVFIALPQSILTKTFCLIEERFMPEFSTEKDLQYLEIRRNLLKKREAFLNLGQLYSKTFTGKEIISYQFVGMARTLESLLDDLGGRITDRDSSQSMITLTAAQASYAYDQISGDSMAAFAFNHHDVALIISDGMGKGSKAAEESTLVVETLSRLLQAGFDVDLAMKTINGILMTGNQDERFATVDLAIIDRKKARAKIFKMGAATTFIKHDGRVSMLKRQALPAGITQGLQLEYIDIKLKKGDILIMVSDGVTDCDRKDPNCNWLRERLLEIRSKDPEIIAELIVNKAAEKYGIRERDDLSVIVGAIGV